MTIEESKVMWQLETSNIDASHFTKPMKKLYDKVGVLIEEGKLLYDEFTSDMIDAMTDIIVQNGKDEAISMTRTEQVNLICESLLGKYEFKERESERRSKEVSVDSTVVQTESELCESECTNEAC